MFEEFMEKKIIFGCAVGKLQTLPGQGCFFIKLYWMNCVCDTVLFNLYCSLRITSIKNDRENRGPGCVLLCSDYFSFLTVLSVGQENII